MTNQPKNRKTFAAALSLATMGGEWKKVDADYGASRYISTFDGRFPSEGVTARLIIDSEAKEYILSADKNGQESLNERNPYTVLGAVPASVAMTLSQTVFGTVNESVTVGDVVDVDGDEAVVSDDDAPGDTIEVKRDGETEYIDKARLEESFLGMMTVPPIERMKTLSGNANKTQMSPQDAADHVRKVTSGFDFTFGMAGGQPQGMTPVPTVPDSEWKSRADAAICELELVFPQLNVRDFAQLSPRVRALLEIFLSEASLRPKK